LAVGRCIEQPLQGTCAGIVENLSGSLSKPSLFKLSKFGFIPLEGYFFHHGFLRGLQQGIKPTEDDHGEYHIPILAPDIDILEAVVGDEPDEGDEFGVGGGVHGLTC